MKNWKSYLLALLLGLCSFGAHAVVITFDDIVPSLVPTGYKGFTWTNFGIEDGIRRPVPNGYTYGVISPRNVAYNSWGDPAQISSATAFNFEAAYFTGAWNDNLRITVNGYIGSVLAYSTTVIASHFAPTLFNFNFDNVTRVQFITAGGTPVPGLGGAGTHFAMDNVYINESPVRVAEPGMAALAGLGLLALVFTRRRA